MFTLASAKNLSQDMLTKGVIETMEMTSGVMARLPFVEVVGSGYAYNVMEDLPAVGYREVNSGYTESTANVTKAVESLVILGGDSDTDCFLQKTHSNFNDLRALNTQAKAKATARKFEADFFAGNGESGALKGLDKRITDGIAGKEIKKALSLDALNELLDTVVDGPDAIFMSKTMRREVLKLLQENSHYVENGTDNFGRPVQYYGGVEIVPVDDSLIPAGKVYAVKFGADQYTHGLSNSGIQAIDLGQLQEKPVYRVRIEFYCGLATLHKRCFAVLNTNLIRSK